MLRLLYFDTMYSDIRKPVESNTTKTTFDWMVLLTRILKITVANKIHADTLLGLETNSTTQSVP